MPKVEMRVAEEYSGCVELQRYVEYLKETEHSQSTIEKYERDLRMLLRWLEHEGNGESSSAADARQSDSFTNVNAQAKVLASNLSRSDLIGWKAHLSEEGYAPASVNAKLSALNGFLAFLGKPDLKVKFLKVQRRVFRDPARDLTRKDYERLVREALRSGDEQIALVMEAIGSTGMRVSEVKFLTVAALRDGKVEVALKGKVRTILLPGKLKSKLSKYVTKKGITNGPVFQSQRGDALSRFSIWSRMKALCKRAKVKASKVFPHNLRHLFAKVFYSVTRDIVKLADVLGHASIETTRIYLISSGMEHARLIERLGLVIEGV